MTAKDLGRKHVCWKCGTKFYDLKKADPVCPKCGSDPREAPTVRAPPPAERRRAAREDTARAPPEAEEPERDEDLEEGEDDAEDADDE